MFRSGDKARPIFAVVRENGDDSLFVTAFRADWKYTDKRRVGDLLYQRTKAG